MVGSNIILGYEMFGEYNSPLMDVNSLEGDCLTCPAGTEAKTKCKDGRRSGTDIVDRDCSAIQQLKDCATKEDKEQVLLSTTLNHPDTLRLLECPRSLFDLMLSSFCTPHSALFFSCRVMLAGTRILHA